MTIAYQHRPLSKILAPTAGREQAKSLTEEPKPRDEKGRFVAADDSNVPEKYRGKSVEDVIKMHQNSESRLGQLQNEVGQLRGLVSDLSMLQREPAPTTEPEEDLDLSGDDLLRDPAKAIQQVVQRELKPLKEARDHESSQSIIDKATNDLMRDFPDMESIVMQPEFAKFVDRTPSRQRLRDVAATGQGLDAVNAARTLLEDYADFQAATAPSEDETKEETPVDKARQVANEGAGGDARVTSDELIYEADVVELINSDPDKYRSPSFQSALLAAIREGRYVRQ